MAEAAAAFRRHVLLICWASVALGLVSLAGMLAHFGDLFSWSRDLADVPALKVAVGGVAAGVIFASLGLLVPAAIAEGLDSSLPAIVGMVAVGVVLRVLLVGSTPALEDDFYRYLWDGAVTAQGINPYAYAPDIVRNPSAPIELKLLAADSRGVIERVNHPHLKTIYPPVAQGWFALAHAVSPWSLLAWRLLGFGLELVSLALIFALLRETGRSPLWAALYWWNPVVVKELTNSAHMEIVLLPMVLAALWLAVRRRYVLATTALAFATGTKLWPAMLLPLFLWPLSRDPLRMVAAIAIFGGLALAWLLPPLLGGLDHTSGFVAFATYWQTNSALFQTLKTLAEAAGSSVGASAESAGLVLRGVLAGCVGLLALVLARRAYDGPYDLVLRAALIVAAQFLLSPAQFPWYATWVFILLPFVPLTGLLAITVTIPLYYISFVFAAQHTYELFNGWVLWVIWVPVWLLLMRDGLKWRRDALNWNTHA